MEHNELLLGLVPIVDKGQELIPHKDYEIKQDGKKFYLVKKKKEYPKTYEECIGKLPINWDNKVEGYKSEMLDSFQKLIICRDVYWTMAGEEMGLGKPWEPDWRDGTNKYCIYYNGKEVICSVFLKGKCTLAFPTEEMRDAFYENFKELIESVKELL